MQPDHVGQPRVDRHEVLDLIGGVTARGDRRLVQLGGEVVGRLVAAEDLPTARSDGVVAEVVVPEIDVRLPHPREGVGVPGESGAEEAVPAGDAAVVDEDEVGAGGGAVVGERVDGGDLDGGDGGRVGGERVEAEVGGGLGGGGEDEVGVGPVARGGLGPGRAEGEHERGGGGDVEGRRAQLGVVVVVDGEEAEVVAAGGKRERVAGGLAGRGGREEAERALLRLREAVRLRHHAGGPARGEEPVGEPPAPQGRGEVRRAAAVDVVAVVRRCARPGRDGGDHTALALARAVCIAAANRTKKLVLCKGRGGAELGRAYRRRGMGRRRRGRRRRRGGAGGAGAAALGEVSPGRSDEDFRGRCGGVGKLECWMEAVVEE